MAAASEFLPRGNSFSPQGGPQAESGTDFPAIMGPTVFLKAAPAVIIVPMGREKTHRKRIPEIDFLRGLAILLMVLDHLCVYLMSLESLLMSFASNFRIIGIMPVYPAIEAGLASTIAPAASRSTSCSSRCSACCRGYAPPSPGATGGAPYCCLSSPWPSRRRSSPMATISAPTATTSTSG